MSQSSEKQISRRALAALALAGGAVCASSATNAVGAAGATGAAAVPAAVRADTALTVIDRLEITELIARYAWAYDCGEAEMMADTFTADGSIEAWGKSVAHGRAELIAFAQGLFKERGDKDWQHLTDHHVFDGGSDHCTVYSYYSMLEGTRSDPREFRVRSFGYYASECAKISSEWRFRKRSINRWNSQRAPWRSTSNGSADASGHGAQSSGSVIYGNTRS